MIKILKDKIQGKVPKGHKRSSRWPTVRKHFLAKNPCCALCGGVAMLEVHHKKPFHLEPTLELDESNLIVLCEAKRNGVTCHQWFGHLGNYQSHNANVEEDVALWKSKMQNRPKD